MVSGLSCTVARVGCILLHIWVSHHNRVDLFQGRILVFLLYVSYWQFKFIEWKTDMLGTGLKEGYHNASVVTVRLTDGFYQRIAANNSNASWCHFNLLQAVFRKLGWEFGHFKKWRSCHACISHVIVPHHIASVFTRVQARSRLHPCLLPRHES